MRGLFSAYENDRSYRQVFIYFLLCYGKYKRYFIIKNILIYFRLGLIMISNNVIGSVSLEQNISKGQRTEADANDILINKCIQTTEA